MLILDYININTYSEQKKWLINLEQFIIRQQMPTGIIFEYTKKMLIPLMKKCSIGLRK